MVLRRGDLVKRGIVALGVGFPLAMAVTAAASVLFDAVGLLATADLDTSVRCGPQSDVGQASGGPATSRCIAALISPPSASTGSR
jgi:hypothetical protein